MRGRSILKIKPEKVIVIFKFKMFINPAKCYILVMLLQKEFLPPEACNFAKVKFENSEKISLFWITTHNDEPQNNNVQYYTA